MPDVSPTNVWPELDGKRVASIAAPAFISDATSSSGGRVTFVTRTSTEVAWVLVSTSTATTRFQIDDASSSSAASATTLGSRVVLYGGSS